MKLQALRYFAVLAEELHFGRAADRLAITQPPLSSAIKALEAELDVQLFERNSKQVRLTSAGAAFLVEVRAILERVERARETARAVATGRRGRLDIGMTSSLLYRELPHVLRRFAERMPDIEVTLREMGSAAQIEALVGGELDAGFVNAVAVPPQLASLPLARDALVVCLPEHHPLARQAALEIADLEHERFVMFDREAAPANYDNVIAAFSRAAVHPPIFHAARQWLTIIAMVANGLGIGLVPASTIRSGLHGVHFVPLRDREAVSPALMAWHPDQTSAALEVFVDCARAVIGTPAAARPVNAAPSPPAPPSPSPSPSLPPSPPPPPSPPTSKETPR